MQDDLSTNFIPKQIIDHINYYWSLFLYLTVLLRHVSIVPGIPS